MSKLIDFLGGIKLIEETSSKINGRVQVIKSFAFGTYIQVGGLTQTGGVVNDVWKKSLSVAKKETPVVSKCLILGLGGGGNASIVRKMWPNSEIIGVDIDPVMVDIGKKYFGLLDSKVKIVVGDAYDYVSSLQYKKMLKFDLVLVDLYIGDTYPVRFENKKFISMLKKIVSNNGSLVINRLYYGDKRSKAVKFLSVLEKEFKSVKVVYPEANVMFVCSSRNIHP